MLEICADLLGVTSGWYGGGRPWPLVVALRCLSEKSEARAKCQPVLVDILINCLDHIDQTSVKGNLAFDSKFLQ